MFALVRKWADKAGLVTPGSPHMLRHSYATDMYEKGVQLNAISALLGHRSILTTVRYIGLSFSSLRRSGDKGLPHPGRQGSHEQLDPQHETDIDDGDADAAAA